LRQRSPSLNALRAFEAAGRLSSFTMAADELCVTPGAVSRQIKYLETLLGGPLFHRHHREVVLTDNARDYLQTLTRAFGIMQAGTERFLQSHSPQRLDIYCSMTLTMRWLVPRLGGFHRAHPKREVALHTSIPTEGHLRGGVASVAVRQGRDPWPDFEDISLISTRLVPVCSPALALEVSDRSTARMFDEVMILQSHARPHDWRSWSETAEVDLQSARALQFESSSLAFEAALNGVGVAIGQLPLVLEDLRSGRLVTPSDVIVEDGSAIFLTARPEFTMDARFTEFRDWIRGEAVAYRAEEARYTASAQVRVLQAA